MVDPRKKRYLYLMLAGFGAISLSIVLFFVLDRMRGIAGALDDLLTILSPFIYGGVVAYLVRPLCNAIESFLERYLPTMFKKSAPILAVIFSMVALVLVVYALIAMIVPQVYDSIISLWNSLPSRVDSFIAWAESTFGEDDKMDVYFNFFNTSYEKLYQELDVWVRETLVPQVGTLVSGVGSSVFKVLRSLYNLLVGMIVAFYVLFSRKRFASQSTLMVRSLFSEKWANSIINEFALMDRMFGGFIDAKILDSAIIGVFCYIGCSILRMPNTLLVSVFIGVTNIIPFFGPLIGAVPSALLILIEDPLKAVWFVIFVLVLQQLDGNLLGPRIMGNRIGISGFWVMFAIIFFGGTWGLFGMIVGVPLTAVGYDLVRKLVRQGLRRKGKGELWDQYAARYPNEDLQDAPPKKKEKKSREEVQAELHQLYAELRAGCVKVWKWLKKAAAFIWKWVLFFWKYIRKFLVAVWSVIRKVSVKLWSLTRKAASQKIKDE